MDVGAGGYAEQVQQRLRVASFAGSRCSRCLRRAKRAVEGAVGRRPQGRRKTFGRDGGPLRPAQKRQRRSLKGWRGTNTTLRGSVAARRDQLEVVPWRRGLDNGRV